MTAELEQDHDPRLAHCLRRSTLLAAALVAGVLIPASLVGLMPVMDGARFLAAPAALAGPLGLITGFRFHVKLREGIPAAATLDERCSRFLRAIMIPLAITEGVALFGLVAFLVSRRVEALLGVATHVLLAGAIWPTEEKLRQFLER